MAAVKVENIMDVPDSNIGERFFGTPQRAQGMPGHTTTGHRTGTQTRSGKKQSMLFSIMK